MQVETVVKTINTAADMVASYKDADYSSETIEGFVTLFAVKLATTYVELERAKLPRRERNSKWTMELYSIVWKDVYDMACKGARREPIC